MKYKVEFENMDGETVMPYRVDSLDEAVRLFREEVERGDYWDGTYDDDFDESGRVSGTISIFIDGDESDWKESRYVEATYKGKRYKVEFSDNNGETVLPYKVDSLNEAVRRFREEVERGDYWSPDDKEPDNDYWRTISGRISIFLDDDESDWKESQYIEATYKEKK